MQPIEEKNPRWFVYSSYQISGRPKLEAAVMDYADVNYMGALISESEFGNVVADLNAKADKIRETNKRLQPVEIKVVKSSYSSDRAHIFIGHQSLRLMRVKAVFE